MVFGHRYRFHAEGRVMTWSCQRGCGAGDSKTYESAARAAHYAAALDTEDRDDLGRRAPLLGLFPLRMFRWLQRRSQRDAANQSGGSDR